MNKFLMLTVIAVTVGVALAMPQDRLTLLRNLMKALEAKKDIAAKADACDPNPCQNGGRCSTAESAHETVNFSCHCVGKYSGLRCEHYDVCGTNYKDGSCKNQDNCLLSDTLPEGYLCWEMILKLFQRNYY
jgi:hypothetical protein